MKYMRGYSLIEVLLYVAILAIISVVLANFFLVSATGNIEHSARDDLAQTSDDIKLALDSDITSATTVLLPSLGSSSTQLVLVLDSGTTTWTLASNALTRTDSSGVRKFGAATVTVRSVTFSALGGIHMRLNATTTRIEYHVDLGSSRENLTRAIEGAGIVGHQGL